MSNFYNKASVIGGPPDPAVLTQLRIRKKLLDKGSFLSTTLERSTEDLLVLNSNSGWVRMMSSVDVLDPTTNAFSSDLAKKYVMVGGSLYNNPELNSFTRKQGFDYDGKNTKAFSSYEKSSLEGFVPMPGITNFVVQSKNQFGTLRVGSIEFQANSIEQLSDLEKLFLRPGFSVLLEWGHSVYLDNTGSRVNGHPGIEPKEFFSIFNKKKIVERVQQEKAKSSGNYDAVFAFIKNFTWSLSRYGAYDCKVDIVSMGEIVESLKVLIDPNTTVFAGTGYTSEDTDARANLTPLHQVLHEIKNSPADVEKAVKNNKKLGLIDEALKKIGKKLMFHRFANGDVGEDKEPTPYNYVPLHVILETLNQTMVLKDCEGNIVTFYSGQLKPDSKTPLTPYVTFPWHFILNPAIGFLPKHSLNKMGFNFAYSKSTKDYLKDDITDICISIDHALAILDGVCNEKEVTDQVLLNFLQQLLLSVQDSAGNINEFALHYEEDEFMFYIIDRNVTPPGDQAAVIDTAGLGSVVESINISSRLTSKISNIVAISAQAAGTDAGDELFAMQQWNYGLVDRIIPERNFKKCATSKPKPTGTPDDNKNDISENDTQLEVAKLFSYTKEIEKLSYNSIANTYVYSTLTFTITNKPDTDISGLKSLHRRLMYRVLNNTIAETNSAPPNLIPLSLQLKMLGIGGLKVGQVFHLPEEILPSSYRGEAGKGPKIGFMIFDPSHTIQNNRWVTDLRCSMVLTEAKKSRKARPVKELEQELVVNSDLAVATLTPVADGKSRKDIQGYVTGQQGVELIKSSEGLELEAYPDPGSKGKPITIGYGTTKINGANVLPGQKITAAYAETLLKADLKQFENGVKKYVKVPLSQGEFDALVSFSYNCGLGNLSTSTLLQQLNAGRYEAASEQFIRWNKAKGKVLPGLTKRRTREANMFRAS